MNGNNNNELSYLIIDGIFCGIERNDLIFLGVSIKYRSDLHLKDQVVILIYLSGIIAMTRKGLKTKLSKVPGKMVSHLCFIITRMKSSLECKGMVWIYGSKEW